MSRYAPATIETAKFLHANPGSTAREITDNLWELLHITQTVIDSLRTVPLATSQLEVALGEGITQEMADKIGADPWKTVGRSWSSERVQGGGWRETNHVFHIYDLRPATKREVNGVFAHLVSPYYSRHLETGDRTYIVDENGDMVWENGRWKYTREDTSDWYREGSPFRFYLTERGHRLLDMEPSRKVGLPYKAWVL